MVLSAVLGAFHALTPGHGKALLASYLVGSRGTVGHALALGGSVTVTHTASVIATGVVVLVAGNLFMPTVLVPALELLAGGLVVLLGLRLLLSRWRGLVTASQSHDHGPGSHAHDHGDHDHPHSHAPQTDPLGDRVRWRDVAVMGFTGGILPCPEAIGILLVAIGLNRVALGLGLITAFSVGLALVLCTLGILLIRSRGLLDRAGLVASPLQRYLPFASAVVVTLLGSVMAFKGISAMLT
jgi:ABC-type nickel/cobalt efflux system permease component RcnA